MTTNKNGPIMHHALEYILPIAIIIAAGTYLVLRWRHR